MSAIVFETLLLRVIWLGSLFLSLVSLAVMLLLILRRMEREQRNKRMLRRKTKIQQCFYAAIKSPVALTVGSLPRVKPPDFLIIMRCAVDMLRTLRGEDVQRIITVLKLWDMFSYLHKTASSGPRGKRIQALTLLGYCSDNPSLEVLLQHATHKDIYIQIAALRGLALRGVTSHIPYIVNNLTHSGQTNTLILSDILQRFGGVAVPTLLELVQSDANAEVRIAGIMALGSTGSLHEADTLIKLTGDPDPDVRAQTIAALGKIGDKRAAKVIASHLTEDEVVVRVQAAQALGNLQVLDTMPQLAARLADDNWWVRFRSAEALFHFGDKGIAALKAISTQGNNAGLIALQVLQEFGATV